MLKRSLVFSSAVSLSLKASQLVVTFKDDLNDRRTIPIEDIGCILIENQMTSITMPAINALADANVSVIFCNNKSMPNAILQSMDANTTQGESFRNQIRVGEVFKKQLWKQIIEAKIKNQSLLLNKLNKNGDMLKPFYMNVRSGDSNNREGLAARLYWQELFGKTFLRDKDGAGINVLLNYGYSILRAAVARSLMSSGLLPAIGLFHHNRNNTFPLADDVMEPYRPFIDGVVYSLSLRGIYDLNKESKNALINILYLDTQFDKIKRPLMVGLATTTSSLAKCYSKEDNKIVYPLVK